MMKKLLIIFTVLLVSAGIQTPPTVAGICYLTDYQDLQEAVDECPNGGTVIIPVGIYEIGTVNLNNNSEWQKVVTIQGAGHGHLGQAPGLGSTQWDYLLNHPSGLYHYGTVLRGSFVVNHRLNSVYFRNFAMIGHGEGIAIDYGDNVNMFSNASIENVALGNYETAMRFRRSYFVTISDVMIAGVSTGLEISDSNRFDVSSLDIVNCDTGVNANGNGNTFIGGSVESCITGLVLGGFSSVVSGYYFEDLSDSSLVILGRGNTVMSNYYAGNSGKIEIVGHNNYLFTSEIVTPIEISGNYNRVDLSAYGSCEDSGFANECNSPYP